MKSDTPRTDDEIKYYPKHPFRVTVDIEFAKGLELENAALRAEIEQLKTNQHMGKEQQTKEDIDTGDFEPGKRVMVNTGAWQRATGVIERIVPANGARSVLLDHSSLRVSFFVSELTPVRPSLTQYFCRHHAMVEDWTQGGCPVCATHKARVEAVAAHNELAGYRTLLDYPWKEDGDFNGEPAHTRLYKTVSLYGVDFHLEAIEVKEHLDVYVAANPALEPDLDRLTEIANGGTFQHATINNRLYVIFMRPFCL